MGRPTTYVALLRGINVGRHKRLAMADLRELLTGLGYTGVRTHLQSGNAVFRTTGRPAAVEQAIERAIETGCGMSVRVLVRTLAELAAVVERNTLPTAEGSRLFVSFLDRPVAEPSHVDKERYAPEDYRIGEREVYLWCPNGLAASELVKEFLDRRLDRVTTVRNWNTVVKLLDLMRAADAG